MSTPDVLSPPATRRDRADREFGTLFAALFAPLAYAVHRVVGDRATAERIARDAFLELLVHWRRVTRSEHPDVASWEERTATVYAAVLAAADLRKRHRNFVLAGVAAAVALAAAAVVAPGADPEPPPAAAGLAPPPWAIEPRGHPLGGPLDGRWQTDPLTRADVANALRRAGLEEYAEEAARFPAGRFRIRLTVDGGRSVLTVGSEREVRIFRVDGRHVTLETLPPNLAISHFHWSGERPWLTLAYAGPGLVKHGAIATQIHEVALYTTARFERARP